MPKHTRHPEYEPIKSTLIACRRNTDPAIFLYKNPKGEFFLHEVIGKSSTVEPISSSEAALRYPSFPEHQVTFGQAFPDENKIDYLEGMLQVLKDIQSIMNKAHTGGVGDLLELVHLQSELLELLVKDRKQNRC